MSDSSQNSHSIPQRKSKWGCKVCKARKIKCDEKRPVCGNCHKRFPDPSNHCVFEHAAPESIPIPSIDPKQGSSGAVANVTSNFSASKTMELKLFHHFSTVTCLNMPTCEASSGLKMWKDIIPALAFECPYIYTGILAIAALHLLNHTDDRAALIAAAYQYMGETVEAYRKELDEVDSSNAEKRFIASILLAMHAKLRARYENHMEIPYTPPVAYFVLQGGARNMWFLDKHCGSDLRAYVACYSHLGWPYKPPLSGEERYITEDLPFDALPSFLGEAQFDKESKAVYKCALDYLDLIKSCISSGERAPWIRQRLSIAPCAFGDDFTSLLQNRDHICLLILARLFAMFTFVDDVWWLEGTASFEVKGLAAIIPGEWQWGMEWPLQILDRSWSVTEQEDLVAASFFNGMEISP